MQRRTLSELQTADGTTLHFTPYGLGIGYALTQDGSTEYIQELVGRHELVPDVPESLRQVYERLRTAHTYGVLEYDLFTVAESLAYLTFEGALRSRFVDAYGGTIPFARSDCIETVAATSFDDVFRVVRRSGRYGSGWTLLGTRSRGRMHKSFNGSFRSLLRWARSEGFLDGQRSRAIENKAITSLRNWTAHPERYHRCSPIDSARTIGDVAEFINRLWGHRTPGGHLYPTPIERRPRIVVRSLDGRTSTTLEPDDLLRLHHQPQADEWRSETLPLHRTDMWAFTIVLCPCNLDVLFYAHIAGWDRAPFPIDVLWGPGSLAGAASAWTEQPSTWAGDAVETVDRIFLVRYPTPGGQPEFPVALERANDLDERPRDGHWLVVVADVPGDALEHAHAVNEGRHEATGECDDCRVHSHGLFESWDEARAVADHVHAARAVTT